MKNTLPALLTILVMVGSANAHEGHGTDGKGHTVQHYLTEPIHLAGIALALSLLLVGAMCVARLTHRRSSNRIVASMRTSPDHPVLDRIDSPR